MGAKQEKGERQFYSPIALDALQVFEKVRTQKRPDLVYQWRSLVKLAEEMLFLAVPDAAGLRVGTFLGEQEAGIEPVVVKNEKGKNQYWSFDSKIPSLSGPVDVSVLKEVRTMKSKLSIRLGFEQFAFTLSATTHPLGAADFLVSMQGPDIAKSVRFARSISLVGVQPLKIVQVEDAILSGST